MSGGTVEVSVARLSPATVVDSVLNGTATLVESVIAAARALVV